MYKKDVALPAGLYRIDTEHEDLSPVSDVFMVADEP